MKLRNILVAVEASPLPKAAPFNLSIALVGREDQKSGRAQFLVSRDDLRALIAAAERALASDGREADCDLASSGLTRGD